MKLIPALNLQILLQLAVRHTEDITRRHKDMNFIFEWNGWLCVRGPKFNSSTSCEWPTGQLPTSWDFNKFSVIFTIIVSILTVSSISTGVLNNITLTLSDLLSFFVIC